MMSRWKRALSISLSISFCFCIGWVSFAQSAIAQNITPSIPASPVKIAPSGESLFEANCAACHANGGNIIRRGKNLKRRAMKRNGFEEAGAIATIITQGKGIMPAYADRLSEKEIEAIAQYVHQRSEAGW